MSTPEQMLREFHAAKNIHGGLMPERPTASIPDWVRALRSDLLLEEVRELLDAVAEGDVVKIADALADISYVAAGTAVVYGIPFDAVFAEVHRSNMTKTNTPAEAKLVKGPGYEPPEIARILAQPPPTEISEEDLVVVIYEGIPRVARITHRPTGLTADGEGRSEIAAKADALQKLRASLAILRENEGQVRS
jgi:Phosphoribosyl-ATP pyrophosphohydrolase